MDSLLITKVLFVAFILYSCAWSQTVDTTLKDGGSPIAAAQDTKTLHDTQDDSQTPNSDTEAPAGPETPADLPLSEVRSSPFRATYSKCRLRSTDPYIYNRIQDVINMDIKLVEFFLVFPNYTVNPLNVNNTWTFRGTKWARAYSQHGQTLLSLAFNYGVMSLMTLTLGVMGMQVPLVDEPEGCVWELGEEEKINAVMFLLMRDFQDLETEVTLDDQERICHEIVQLSGHNVGEFTDRCCFVDPIEESLRCSTDIINIWLKLLLMVLVSVKFALLFFGPVSFIPFIESIAREDFPYVVELKDPLVKTIYLCNSDTHIDKTYDKVLDLRGKRGFPKLHESLKNIPLREPVKVQFNRYDILVNYKKLLVENDVPVGVTNSIAESLCKCEIRNIGPFVQCCASNIFRSIGRVDKETSWIDVCRVVAKILAVLLAPFPFYVRLYLFYQYEWAEVIDRRKHLHSLGLMPQYEGSLLSFLTPTHPLFIAIYVTYALTAVVLAILAHGERKEKLASIIVGSFRDLKSLSYIGALGVFTGNIIWPFKRYGVLGFLIAPFYWFIVLPFTTLIYLFYCLPTIYVAFRMLWRVNHSPRMQHPSGRYKVVKEFDTSMHIFQTEEILERFHGDDDVRDVSVDSAHERRGGRRGGCRRLSCNFVTNLCLSILCVLTMFGVLVVMSEVVGFIVEIGVFTMMGVIVNAGQVLKYVTLLILVVVYSYDTYNNVGKRYLKLNKALFNEVKGRCKNIDVVTSMPSHLQENHGFKSQELSEQADYEESDDISDERKSQWIINDLVLFVDNEDMPRIPRKLFEEVCQIRVAGAPGPVHQSMIEATKDFLKIMVFIFFVFVVVLTFGAVYRVSSTNQMLAALAGGFLPFIMRTFMAPNKPDIEIGTVSFKSKLDEIIKNFKQNWPIYDFPFELWTEEDERKKQEKENEGKENEGKEGKECKEGKEGEGKDENENTPATEVFHDALPTFRSKLPPQESTESAPAALPPFKTYQGNKTTNPNGGIGAYGIADTPAPSTDASSTAQMQQENRKYDVDILVYLPDASKSALEKWLAEWSDLDSYSDEDNDVDDVGDVRGVGSALRRKRRRKHWAAGREKGTGARHGGAGNSAV